MLTSEKAGCNIPRFTGVKNRRGTRCGLAFGQRKTIGTIM